MDAATDKRWAAKWVSNNQLDGRHEHLIRDMYNCNVLLFHTRAAARAFIKEKYGYIATREDLKQEPHGWQVPKAVKIEILFTEVK
jgi:hypothetical protein